ncbi:MAG: hypothetical protein EZS28_020130 [Streblomastix strix]|uniref:SPRY domain-containing protein n=1 Tax=Streblomastix strix TaxID=222440 RepID=A0A5J4VP91_9EUKA|nr:MAG: hypothetical protein EZS28_020130 [Streblomastix strix]
MSGIQEDKTNEFENPDATQKLIRLERVDGLNRRAVAVQHDDFIVPLKKEISEGIWKLSGKFDKCDALGGFIPGSVGIVKASHKVPVPCDTAAEPNMDSMLEFHGRGVIVHKHQFNPGNGQFNNNQLIELELNLVSNTLHLFIDGKQQPNFVQGIKEPVKFYCFICDEKSSFTITSLKKLPAPTAKKLANQKAVNW